MAPLDDFLQQGILPFVGREGELHRLLEFWRATPYAQRLRASLVQAEAGIGKSRLLDEVIRRVAGEEGAVVHVKLYPESSVSLGPLLAPALWHSNVGRELLRTEPEGTLQSAIVALRRLCRLRPTLLVLEDTHLLSSDSTPEFASLLNALADETISLLCLCRPAEWRGRTVLEGYLVERIEMEGLNRAAIGDVWECLFGIRPEPAVAGLLHEATLGNALALRSVLRSAIDSRVIVRAGDSWRVSDPSGTFATLMRRNVDLLSAGMVAHLNDRELKGAGRLAALGEVFSREAAGALPENAAELIEVLLAKGILATTPMLPSPLGGLHPSLAPVPSPQFPASAHPLLVFTHTLLHKHLVEHAAVDPAPLVAVIAGNHPLYSLLPFILVHRNISRLCPGTEGMEMAAERSLYVAWLLDIMNDGRAGLHAWDTASGIIGVILEELPEERRQRWPLRLLQIRTSLLRFDRDARIEATRRFYEATRDIEDAGLMPMRLVALAYYLNIRNHAEPLFYLDVWDELGRIAGTYPHLKATDPYLQCLGAVADTASLHVDFELIARIREQVAELEQEEGFRDHVRRRLYPSLMPMYRTPEELADRMRLYDLLDALPAEATRPSWQRRVAFLTHTGRMQEVLQSVDEALPVFQQQGNLGGMLYVRLDQMMARSAFGGSLEEIASDVRELVRGAGIAENQAASSAAEWIAAIGLLRGDSAWGWLLYNEFSNEDERSISPRILLHIARGEMEPAARLLEEEWDPQLLLDAQGHITLREMMRFLHGVPADPDSLADGIIALLGRPMLRLYDIAVMHGAVRVLEELGRQGELAVSQSGVAGQGPDSAGPLSGFAGRLSHFAGRMPEIRAAVGRSVTERLAWLEQRGLDGFMIPLIEACREYLPPEERKRWSASAAAIAGAREEQLRPEGEEHRKVRVSMIGTIQVAPAGGEMTSLRGVRIRTLLGLMVADQMIGASLTPQEFILLAGEDEDPELARKKRNMGVVRLREIMGADTILTDGRTPRLNLDLVEVDLLRADELAKRSFAAAREGAWVRAQPLLLEALELSRGEVPFPTLYEGFFEAARDDFEYRLRSAVLDVARGLLREGDTGGAEDILRHAFAAMPDDEEVAELFRDALVARGKRVEAERIRLRGKE